MDRVLRKGELPAKLMNGNELWMPLMQAYWNANGHEGDMPEDWKKPLVEVEMVDEICENPNKPLEDAPEELPSEDKAEM